LLAEGDNLGLYGNAARYFYVDESFEGPQLVDVRNGETMQQLLQEVFAADKFHRGLRSEGGGAGED
jgi:hypothetical protein